MSGKRIVWLRGCEEQKRNPGCKNRTVDLGTLTMRVNLQCVKDIGNKTSFSNLNRVLFIGF